MVNSGKADIFFQGMLAEYINRGRQKQVQKPVTKPIGTFFILFEKYIIFIQGNK